MGPGLRGHLALASWMPVVADRRGGVERLARCRARSGCRGSPVSYGVRCPYAGVAVRLQLEPHGALSGPVVPCAWSSAALQILDVVAVLVRQDVGLGERPALGAERVFSLEEAEVEVDRRSAGQ